MEDLVVLILLAAWGGICFIVGHSVKTNKVLNKHWPERQEFLQWRADKHLDEQKNNVHSEP